MDGGRDAARDAPADKGPPPCSVDANACGGDTPVCDPITHACRGCQANAECAAPGKPACAVGDGGTNGVCVECTQNSDCTDTAPVCDPHTNTCRGCATDGDCKLHGPGICNASQLPPVDASVPLGRCIRDDETITVSKGTGCSDTQPALGDASAPDGGAQQPGSSTRPFCTFDPVRTALSLSRYVVVVSGDVSGPTWSFGGEGGSPILIVGKSATITGAASPAFQMSAGNVTIRNVRFKTATGIGIEADGGTLRLDHVTVDSCSGGGILLNGAAFDIESSVITNDGPAQTGPASWGGIYVEKLPATGQLKLLNHVTLFNDSPVAIACAGAIDGRNVAVTALSGNVAIQSSCGFDACGSVDAGAGCGAQP